MLFAKVVLDLGEVVVNNFTLDQQFLHYVTIIATVVSSLLHKNFNMLSEIVQLGLKVMDIVSLHKLQFWLTEYRNTRHYVDRNCPRHLG